MKSRLLSNCLSFFLSLVLFQTAHAESALQLSGFVYDTSFSNPDWYKGRTVGAVNTDYMSDRFSLRGQFSTYNNGSVRRLTIETDKHLSRGLEAVFRVGRFPRIDSFFNGITDNPASSGMALLPQSGYSYRMINGSFVLMDGVGTSVSYRLSESLITFNGSTGYMVITSQSDMNRELFKQVISGVEFDPELGYNLALHYQRGDYHAYVSRSDYKTSTRITVANPTAQYMVGRYNDIGYELDKIGIQWHSDGGFAQCEYMTGITDANDIDGAPSYRQHAEDYNATVGYHWTEQWSSYLGVSHGRNLSSNSSNTDHSVGSTFRSHSLPITVSLEYHRGSGSGWRDYTSTLTNWSSWVVSTTYQF